jgi:hypothetical protein
MLPCMAAVIVLTAAACGGDDADGGAGGDDAGDDAGTTGSTEADDGGAGDDDRTDQERAADEAAAEAMLLTIADFPPGWQEEPADDEDDDETDDDETDDDETDELNARLAECLDIDPARFDPDNRSAQSPSFTSANDEEVSVDVAFTPSADAASGVFEVFADDAAPGCFGEVVQAVLEENATQEGLPEGVEMGDATFARLPFPSVGDESTAFRVTVPVSAEGLDIDVYLDAVFVRVGRIGITGQFQTVVAPFDEGVAAELMLTVVDRAPAEEGA